MPPRISPSTSRGGSRGGYQRGGGIRAQGPPAPSASSHITTIGVKRTSFGTSGVARTVLTNHFPVSIPDDLIFHYDVITPSEKTLPARLNMDLITALQTFVAPEIFTPPAVYDGRKNLFAARRLPFPNSSDAYEFDVTLTDVRTTDTQRTADTNRRGPKIYKVKLHKVAEINPIVLQRFLAGQQSQDNDVLTAITALNVVVRMEPTLKYPFNVRSFFTDQEKKEIGSGIVLWRGYFQSVRPAMNKMLINIDISTGTMYKPGPLIDLCLDFFGRREQDPQLYALTPQGGLTERERLRLQRFLSGIRIVTTNNDRGPRILRAPRVVKKVTSASAAELYFTLQNGNRLSVAEYFRNERGQQLTFPHLPCVEVGSGALLPLEICEVHAGQIMRKQIPATLTKQVLTFATKKPIDRLNSIKNGLGVLAHGQSEYVRQFGMHLQNSSPLQVAARILSPPTLKYGEGSRQLTIIPRNGSWNMMDKKFFKPCRFRGFVVVIYESQRRFSPQNCSKMVKGLTESFKDVGIVCADTEPVVRYENGQGRIIDQLKNAGQAFNQQKRFFPDLLIAVLPEQGTDIYTAIKHFGDCITGVATQCLRASKCYSATKQYYANVCLKINVKLGGINAIPDQASVRYLTDPANPTIVMGADVIHPAPGSEGKPSFTSVVANVDSDTAKYIATTNVQESRREMIDDLEEMSKRLIEMYCKYRKGVERLDNNQPKRIIFYRDGVSEGQFQQVLDYEVPKIRNACRALNINPMPKLTVIVVGKRHHVRFFPMSAHEGDNSGNCPAGTVVDRDIGHPTEFDFYLQSHGGLLGTSRPAHYNVLLDESNFTPDGLQQLSFALCHVYARSTRSVSIPAPVYYADIVCSRAKNHFDPNDSMVLSESATSPGDQAQSTLDTFKKGFKPLHQRTELSMYFS